MIFKLSCVCCEFGRADQFDQGWHDFWASGQEVFEIMVESGDAPDKIVEERGMKQVSDEGALAAIIDELVSNNPKQVEQARENPKLVGWFVGQVMKATGGQANPGVVNKLLKAKLA